MHKSQTGYRVTLFTYIYVYTYIYEKHSHQNCCFRGLNKANLNSLHKPMFFPESQNTKIERVTSILYLNYFQIS